MTINLLPLAAMLVTATLLVAVLGCGAESPAEPAHAQPMATPATAEPARVVYSATVAATVTQSPPAASAATATGGTAQYKTAAQPTITGEARIATTAPTAGPTDTKEPTAPALRSPTPPHFPTNTITPPAEAPAEEPTATVPAPAALEGTNVGAIPPAFEMELADGTRIASAEIAASGKPAFMMYFATW